MLRERHVRRHGNRFRGRAVAVEVGGRRAVAGPGGPAVRVRQNHRGRAAVRPTERAQTVVRALLRVRGRVVRGHGRRHVGRVLADRVAVAGRLGVVPPVAVGRGPLSRPAAVVQRGRRVHGRRDGRAPVLPARVRDAPRERVLRHGRRPVVLRVRLHALRGRDGHHSGRGAVRRDRARRLLPRPGRVRPAHRRRADVRLGVPRTVARQRDAGRGPKTRRPRGHARPLSRHRRPVRPRVQSADVHRSGHVRRVVRRTVGQHRMEVRRAVRLGQSVRNRRHQSPLVPGQVPGRLSAAQESHHTVYTVSSRRDIAFFFLFF